MSCSVALCLVTTQRTLTTSKGAIQRVLLAASRILRSAARPRNELPHSSPLIDAQPRAATIIQLLRPCLKDRRVQPNARHHPPAAAVIDESRAVAGRVHAVVSGRREGEKCETSNDNRVKNATRSEERRGQLPRRVISAAQKARLKLCLQTSSIKRLYAVAASKYVTRIHAR